MSEYLPRRSWARLAVLAFYLTFGVLIIYFAVRYLLPLMLPFILAWMIALVLQPIMRTFHRRTRISRGILSFMLVSLVLTFASVGIYSLVRYAATEAVGLVGMLGERSDEITGRITELVTSIGARLRMGESADKIYGALSEFAGGTLASISEKLPDIIGVAAGRIPEIIFFAVILVMASFYICADFDGINSALLRALPERAQAKLHEVRAALVSTSLGYLRAYMLLMLITFVQLLAGFILLDIEYAFIIALVTAVLDALPVFGVGTVLIPWGIFIILCGQYYEGVGLLVLFALVSVVRQIAEPRLVGKSCGLSPLAMIIALYVGFKAFGISGMLIIPIIAIIAKNLGDAGVIKIWKNKEE